MPRRFGSPLQAIIHFFMTAPLAEAQSGLEAAKAVVSNRSEAPVPRRRRSPNELLARQATTAEGDAVVLPPVPTKVVAQVPVRPQPRQRARRSDAGRPRTAAAPAGPVRRRRPAVSTAAAVPAAAVAHELPDSYVPEGADD